MHAHPHTCTPHPTCAAWRCPVHEHLQMLLPALQQLVDLPEWAMWVESLEATMPYPQDKQDTVLQQFRCVRVRGCGRASVACSKQDTVLQQFRCVRVRGCGRASVACSKQDTVLQQFRCVRVPGCGRASVACIKQAGGAALSSAWDSMAPFHVSSYQECVGPHGNMASGWWSRCGERCT